MFGEDVTSEAGKYLITQGIMGVVILFETAAIFGAILWIRQLYTKIEDAQDQRLDEFKTLVPVLQGSQTQLSANTESFKVLAEHIRMQFEIMRERLTR